MALGRFFGVGMASREMWCASVEKKLGQGVDAAAGAIYGSVTDLCCERCDSAVVAGT